MLKITLSILFFLIIATPGKIPISTFPFTSTMSTSINSIQYEYSLSNLYLSVGGAIQIQFQITNSPEILSTTFLTVSYQPTKYKENSVKISDFYNKQQENFEGVMDIVGMRLYRKQFINLDRAPGKNNLYLTVYNLDPENRKVAIDFQINLQGGTFPKDYQCYSCNGGIRNSYSCSCSNCPVQKYTEDCSITMKSLTKNTVYETSTNKMVFFKIQDSQSVIVNIEQSSMTAKGEIYVQYIKNVGQFASYTNTAVFSWGQGRVPLSKLGSKNTLNLNTNGSPISITIIIFDNITTNISIQYSTQSSINILAIILSVLGGVLLIFLVIGVIIIIRRRNSNTGIRESNNIVHNNHELNLNSQEIERFFPTLSMDKVLQIQQQLHEQSNANINQIKRQNQTDECMICLCPILENGEVKVTYCKHIFHSECLISWFQKHQNCPYCREQFNRSHTIKLYKKLKQKNNHEILKGETLIKAILDNKMTHRQISKQILQDKQLMNAIHQPVSQFGQ